MLTSTQDYRDALREVFGERRKRNPHYSLRAFARDLNLHSAQLSDILNGKYGLSRARAKEIAQSLDLSPQETELFLDLVESKHGRSRISREAALIRLGRYVEDEKRNILAEDSFKLISDWYHFALLELCEIKGFKSDRSWIAEQLGITLFEAEQAIARLVRLGMLAEVKGALRPTTGNTQVLGDVPSLAKKNFHSQILQQASKALYFQDFNKREFTANVFAVNEEMLSELKALIQRFRKDFVRKANATPKKDSVYCLAIQLFSLLDNCGSKRGGLQ